MTPDQAPRAIDHHEDARAFLNGLACDDRIELARHGRTETYRVLSCDTNNGGTPFVRARRVDGYGPGATTFKPSSGYRGACIVTHGRGMGTHYQAAEVVEG